jgi:hypothetical protein
LNDQNLSPPDATTIEHIVDRLLTSRSILFVTGAGISSESGLPTYRGVGGLYNNEETEEGPPIEEMLSGEMFKQTFRRDQSRRDPRKRPGHLQTGSRGRTGARYDLGSV